jgi:hypothetical protein
VKSDRLDHGSRSDTLEIGRRRELAGRKRPQHAGERSRKFSFDELDVRLGERLEGSVVLAGQQRACSVS